MENTNSTFNGDITGSEPVVEGGKERDEKGRFLPGTSGNPAGRPKRKSFAEYFNEEEIEILINRIKQEIKGEPKGDIVKMVVEQIFGKPKQPLVGGDEGDNPISILNGSIQRDNSPSQDSETE